MKKILFVVVTLIMSIGYKSKDIILKSTNSNKVNDKTDLVLKHANELFNYGSFGACCQRSHGSHSSHSSHSSHVSGR